MAKHNELGKEGEDQAVAFLEQKGFRILERNYRFRKAEIDIIAQKEELLVAVEVKTRSSTDFGNPQDFITPKKIKLLLMAFENYIIQNDLDVEARLDVIGIVTNPSGNHIEHIEDAFFYFT